MSAENKTPTRVIFRLWPEGIVDAILLDVDASPGHVVCYAHIGQHSEGSYFGVMSQTRPATPAEYQALHAELTGRGYQLYIRKRRSIQGTKHRDTYRAGRRRE